MGQRFVLGGEQEPERVDKVLTRLLPGTSRASVQRWIQQGRVLLDGKPCRARDTANPGSVLDVEPGPLPRSRAEPDASVQFRVLFEDEHLIVIDKPAGLVVHPARGHAGGTLVNGLLAREGFKPAPSDGRDVHGALRPGIVHRIDKDTSGILVVAKDERTREGLKAQLSEHSVDRLYRALTHGVPLGGTIRTLHGRDPRHRLKFTSRTERGRRAVTHVTVLETLAEKRAAFVECRLETGRTHQIRVHLAERARTPILGDKLYGRSPGDADLSAVVDDLGRQALHAAVLGFEHPVTHERHRFESPLPPDFSQALERLRNLG